MAVVAGTTITPKLIFIEYDKRIRSKLEGFWTSRGKNFQDLQNAWDIMDSNGLVDCKIKYYGGLSLMLEWPSKEMAWACIEENLTWLNQWFDSLKPWDDKEPFTRKLTWVCIDGLPIQGRHNRVIKPIVNKLGHILEIRRVDLNSKLIMLVKVLMLVTCSEEIKRSISISLNGYSMFKEEFVDPTMVGDDGGEAIRHYMARFQEERIGCRFKAGEANVLNNFISRRSLFDFPFCGRKFTRFVHDGSKASKLVRILVDQNFFDIWKDASVFVLHRSYLDHCLIFLKSWTAPFAHALVPLDITLKIKLKPTWLIIKNWVADQLKAKNKRKEEIHNNHLDWDVQDKGEMEEHLDKELENLMASFQQLQENGMDQSQGLSLNCNGLGCLVKHDWVKDLPAGEANVLNNFISRRSLFDFPLCGRKFTWFVCDGSKASKLDRILVDRNFFDIWKDASVFILGSRLAKVIGSIIGPDQSTFTKGSQILDGCLIANEIVHMAKLEDQRMFLFKVDFKKAFDSVNWNFLLDIMRKMGFGLKWRKWISSCQSLASISVLINGSYSNNFFMERDLRQREPFSPFSFILVVEALQVTILNACDRGIFKGVCFSNSGSGLKVNLDNSRLFGVRVLDNEVSTIAYLLGCAYRTHPFSYLGLTVGGKMGLCNSWQEIINRFKDRLLTWKTKTLFVGGRLTLVKSILDGGFGSSILANSESGVWLDAVKACKCIEDKFPKLFALEIDKDCKVKDRGQVANNVSIGNWLWRIPPRGRTLGDLNTLSSKLGNVKFSSYGSDKWSWSYDSSESFKVKILSKVLENNLLGDISLGLHYK
ncbi:putative RNA-directed DNA polymerase, eukaryota, reverse transcriptase zinc-binding domain protein [Tanacetum coccineum]